MDDSAEEQSRTRQALLPIIVLFNCTLSDSMTFQTFIASSRHALIDPALIAVYDNSPIRQVSVAEEANLFAYRHDPANSGLAAAYNWAMEIAKLHGISWLLLLDQDSQLPSTFMASLIDAMELYDTNKSVAAIVPFVKNGLADISPMRVRFGRLSPLPKQSPSLAKCEVTAINSGAAIRVSFIQSLGGFNLNYRLDCLDHWLFRQLFAQGKRVALSRSVLEHYLSVSDYRNQVSLTRYRSIISAEALFVKTEKPFFERLLYVIRLAVRAVKQLVVYRMPEIAKITGLMIYLIITQPSRIQKDWMK
jgi:GT2 family glycosyltransferase